jgi:PHP family Zn ribbon phosphoesterase
VIGVFEDAEDLQPEGCGRRIVAKDGRPDFRKHFCGPACLKINKRERLQAKRLRLENRRCSHCGRKPVRAVSSLLAVESDESEKHPPMPV